ncbi:DUF1254 domain-containing protein [Shewanella sp. YLB-07]|uniref:DUF1254 domain-containing protein n=1 Tax=Shewanella sp. YLB-07 TaxID=2601268 RepID=UPI00128AE033|nr:DUF1254 domain-containing protein [Shewanella sp. YLB-07]MPY21140.1 DUF1254 domain-containing protein [Shewanella sp. YLB-07]MPY21927.1 DUF1254 domain-containing protein [Shewanella sp. YLB-07]
MKIIMTIALYVLLTMSSVADAKGRATPPPELGTLKGAEAEAFYLGVNAVIWGYPIVFFEDLIRGRTRPDAEAKTGNPQAQINEFALVRQLRGPEFKAIATPNNDTLYAQAFTDVSREPMVLSVPEVEADRYYTMQLWDPNGDTFAYVGSRTTGVKAGDFALVGPDWKGNLPPDVKRIDSEYNSLVIWGRIGVKGSDDVKNANKIQDKLRLTPLSQFQEMKNSGQEIAVDKTFSMQRVAYTKPADLAPELEFYYKLARSLKFTPPKERDIVIADSLQQIGFRDDNLRFDYSALSDAQKSGLTKAYQFALHLMDSNAASTGESVNGWRWSRKSGIMGTDYLFRAAWAKWYTGGNTAKEAIYMDGRKDDKGQPFNGDDHYLMHFPKDQLPHVKAFWSVSMYDLNTGAFIENPIKRYSIGGRTQGLIYNDDGSLDIFLQNEAPIDAKKKSNWLPAPTKGFYLNLRLYIPDDSLQQGLWKPPVVQQVDK